MRNTRLIRHGNSDSAMKKVSQIKTSNGESELQRQQWVIAGLCEHQIDTKPNPQTDKNTHNTNSGSILFWEDQVKEEQKE